MRCGSVGDVQHGRARADQQILVVDAQPGETETDEVDQVRDHGVPRQHARAPSEEHGALRREVLRLLDARRTVIAPDAVCPH